MRQKPNVKNTMQIHSQAKVRFYQEYLTRYLRILYKSEYIQKINIFDVFCGAGIYEDGKAGSAVVAYNSIKEVFYENNKIKKVCLFLNDGNKKRINNVKTILDAENEKNQCCDIRYLNFQAADLLAQLQRVVENTKNDVRNLIFIDPYGYKDITKDIIFNLLNNKHTEIILFLPIYQMYRFTSYALDNAEIIQYKPLNDFICSYFTKEHPIVKKEELSILQYISFLKEAFSYNNSYYTASYHIERNKSQYFSLFFLTSHIYGLEKILEVKWDLNEVNGSGFNLPTQQLDLFAEQEADEEQKTLISNFNTALVNYLQKQRTNNELYYFTLQHEFLPKHINLLLSELQKSNKITVNDIHTGKAARKNSFYISYTHCKPQSSPKIYIKSV